ncbi:hypothetical protein [Candidatus Enterococcus ferrettii]
MNKSKKKLLMLVYLISLIVCGIFFGADYSHKKEQVEAHPTNTIKLDEGGSNEFILPIDASKLEEQALKDLAPKFNDYVQGDNVVPVLEKQDIDIFGSAQASNGYPVYCSILGVEETNGGNYFILFSVNGASSGGIIRTAVYNKDGEELASNSVGSRNDPYLRVNTKLFNASNNNYLVFTQNESFFRYTVTESGNTASIQRNQCNVTGSPNGELLADAFQIVNQFGDYSNNVLLSGRIYPYSKGAGRGIYKNRLSFGTVNTSGWLGGTFNGGATYQYSVQNLLLHEDLDMAEDGLASLSMTPIYRRNGHIFGRIGYADIVSVGSNTFQIFSDEEITDTEVGNNGGLKAKKVKRRVYHHLSLNQIKANNASGKIIGYSVVENLCSDDYVYFFADDGEKCELIRVNLTTYQDEIVKTYPTGISLNFMKNTDGTFSYYGSSTELSGELSSNYYPEQPVSGTHYFISGIMNGITGAVDDLKVKSLRAFEVNGGIGAQFAIEGQNNTIFVAGYSWDYTNFPTEKFMIDEQSPNYTRTMNQNETPSGYAAFIGKMEIKDDYSPIVKKASDITVNLDDPAISTPSNSSYLDWTTLDRWLITGSKAGDVTDAASIKVYDHFDSNDNLIAGTAAERAEWLQKRINRNPNDIGASIEWGKLGFDATTTGPQLVTYFVADSQNQSGVTSRWVNKKSAETIVDEDDKYALDAQNFHVPLTGIDSTIPDENKFKELAKTMAWSLTKHESTDGDQGSGLDEDGSDSSKLSTKVTVDTVQLKALREATVAKPYPVDVTYKPESGIEIKNRVWVFVTTKNTVPNSETNPKVTPADTNGVVYYADDYSLPFRLRAGHTTADVLDRGNVRVYDYYDSSHETDAELPVLADKDTNSNHLQVLQLGQIHIAWQPGILDFSPPDGPPMIRYEWQGPSDGNHQAGDFTLGGLDVTLSGDVLLHVRQVILGDSDKLIVPKEGYLRLKTNEYDSGTGTANENSDYLLQVKIPSGTNADNPGFETFAVSTAHMNDEQDELELELVLPEYYEQIGYYLTHGQFDPNGAEHQGKTEADIFQSELVFHHIGLVNDGEYFITIYLKPRLNQEGPQPYSWDYKKNDLGKIKTK